MFRREIACITAAAGRSRAALAAGKVLCVLPSFGDRRKAQYGDVFVVVVCHAGDAVCRFVLFSCAARGCVLPVFRLAGRLSR